MPATNAIIFIPDISGFTRFMSSLELEHASHILSSFLETIVQKAEDKFEVSEIEGDAVLLYKKGGIATKKEILDQCIEIFNAFHYQRKTMQQVVLCHCGACQSIINLSLKFVAHAGVISEIKVNRFTKASGVDMIIAHRLLKNHIHSDEYILLTDNFLQQLGDSTDQSGLTWQSASEEFPSLRKVSFEFALLEGLKASIPDPPKHLVNYDDTDKTVLTLIINAPFKEAYMALIDITGRVHWVPGLREIKEQSHHPSIGSIHLCLFDDVVVTVSPALIRHEPNEIFYAETLTVETSDIFTLQEYRFQPVGDTCKLSCRILPMEGKNLSAAQHNFLFDGLRTTCQSFKAFCENAFQPLKK